MQRGWSPSGGRSSAKKQRRRAGARRL